MAENKDHKQYSRVINNIRREFHAISLQFCIDSFIKNNIEHI